MQIGLVEWFRYKVVEEKIAMNPNKNGVADALKEIVSEYNNSIFMYDTKSVDFISFFNRLSEEERNELSNKSYIGAKGMINKPFLKKNYILHKKNKMVV